MTMNAWRVARIGLALASTAFFLSCDIDPDAGMGPERGHISEQSQALAVASSDCTGDGCSTANASTVSGNCYGDDCTTGRSGNGSGNCYGTNCKTGHASNGSGNCFGTGCATGSAGNAAGDCVGDSCTAGFGGNVGGDCVGDGCTAGNAHNAPGDCYAPNKNCTPGKSWLNGTAYDIDKALPKYCCAHFPTYANGKFSSKIKDQSGWNSDGKRRTGFDYYFYGQPEAKKVAVKALCEGKKDDFECPDDAWLNGNI